MVLEILYNRQIYKGTTNNYKKYAMILIMLRVVMKIVSIIKFNKLINKCNKQPRIYKILLNNNIMNTSRRTKSFNVKQRTRDNQCKINLQMYKIITDSVMMKLKI